MDQGEKVMKNLLDGDWYLSDPTQCPSSKCNGLLLSNIFRFDRKCNKCDKCFISVTIWKEVEDDGR